MSVYRTNPPELWSGTKQCQSGCPPHPVCPLLEKVLHVNELDLDQEESSKTLEHMM